MQEKIFDLAQSERGATRVAPTLEVACERAEALCDSRVTTSADAC